MYKEMRKHAPKIINAKDASVFDSLKYLWRLRAIDLGNLSIVGCYTHKTGQRDKRGERGEGWAKGLRI